ncbi:DUF1127 domain-containing protein [Methylobacterium planeticum]
MPGFNSPAAAGVPLPRHGIWRDPPHRRRRASGKEGGLARVWLEDVVLVKLVSLSRAAIRAYDLKRKSRAELARFTARDLADIGLPSGTSHERSGARRPGQGAMTRRSGQGR